MNKAETDLLTVRQIAAKLGMSRSAVDRMKKRRLIPYVKINARNIRYRWQEVEAAIARRTVKAL